jgi:hypothetical protein
VPQVVTLRAPSGVAGPPDPERLRGALGQLAGALAALHRAGKVHRDVKPSNVLITPEGRVVLLDFGLVSDHAEPGGDSLRGRIVGTPAYMAPAQMTGDATSAASDWYAVGVMLYEPIAGRLPFDGPTFEALAARCRYDAPPIDPARLRIAPDLGELCLRLLARGPSQRPDGAQVIARLGLARPPVAELAESALFVGRTAELGALREALARAAGGQPVVARVRGGSGTGKSALVRRFTDELRAERRALVLEGRCWERESLPFKALDGVVDALARHLDDLGPGAASILPRDAGALARLFPVLTQVPTPGGWSTGGVVADPIELRRRASAALRQVFVGLAERSPVVVWIDDVQWGDLDSAQLIDELLRPPHAPALLLPLGERNDAESACMRALERTLDCERCEIAMSRSASWRSAASPVRSAPIRRAPARSSPAPTATRSS